MLTLIVPSGVFGVSAVRTESHLVYTTNCVC